MFFFKIFSDKLSKFLEPCLIRKVAIMKSSSQFNKAKVFKKLFSAKGEFLDVIETIVLRVFLLAIQSYLYEQNLFETGL